MKLILDDGTEINITLSEEEIAKLCKKEESLWFPKNGEKAWYIDYANVKIYSSSMWYKNDEYYIFKHKLGHIFKTEEEAKKHFALIEAKYKVRKRIVELNEGWTPDWTPDLNDGKQFKYFIIIYENKLNIDSKVATKYQPNWIYLKSRELTKQLIEELATELRIVLEE
jgi:hypothetical protein